MKREVDVPKLIWRGARLGTVTAMMTLLMLWLVGALLRWEAMVTESAKIPILLAVGISALIAQYTDRSKGKGIVSALIGTVCFLFLLLLLGVGIPHTTVKPAALLLPGTASLMGYLIGLLLHFNKTYSRNKIRRTKYNKT